MRTLMWVRWVRLQGLPWRPSGWDSVLPIQGTQVRSLVRELRSYVLCSLAMPHPPNGGATGQRSCWVLRTQGRAITNLTPTCALIHFGETAEHTWIENVASTNSWSSQGRAALGLRLRSKSKTVFTLHTSREEMLTPLSPRPQPVADFLSNVTPGNAELFLWS